MAVEGGHGTGTSSCGHDAHSRDLGHTQTQVGLTRTQKQPPLASREGTVWSGPEGVGLRSSAQTLPRKRQLLALDRAPNGARSPELTHDPYLLPGSADWGMGEGMGIRYSLKASPWYLHPHPSAPPHLILPQVSVQLQGLLQGPGHHLLPPAQEGLLLGTQIKAQVYGKLLRAVAGEDPRVRDTRVAWSQVGQAHSSCQITSLLPTPRTTLSTALPCPTTTLLSPTGMSFTSPQS